MACEIVTKEVNIDNEVTKRLSTIVDCHVNTVLKQKRVFAKSFQDNERAKMKYQVRCAQ